MIKKLALSLALSGASLLSIQAMAAPKVVTTIAPIHSITSAIMQNVGEPAMLVDQSASPHATKLLPSQARDIQNADFIIWVGPKIETFLIKPLETLPHSSVSLPVSSLEGMTRLEKRQGGNWDKHRHGHDDDHGDDHGSEHGKKDDHESHGHDDHGHKDAHDKHDDHKHDEHKKDHAEHGHHDKHEAHHGKDEKHDEHHDEHKKHPGHDHDKHDDHEAETRKMDQHMWLDPQNGIIIANAVTEQLIKLDPENKEIYTKNNAALIAKIKASMKTAAATLKDSPKSGFIVLHDAYQYFENRFGMSATGSVMLHAGVMPGAARVKEIRKKLTNLDVACVMAEPQFDAKILPVLIEGTKAKIGSLDPLGQHLKAGPDLYPNLISSLANNLADCLKK